MAYSVPTLITNFNAGINGSTTGNFNTTGYDLLIICVSHYTSTVPTITDNKNAGNWSEIHSSTTAGLDTSAIYWRFNPTVGANHTFTVSGTSTYCACSIVGCAGSQTSSDPKDQSNTAIVEQGSGTTIQPGSVTPSTANQLVISSFASGASANADMTLSTPDGFTKLTGIDFVGGTNIAGSTGYRIETTATAANPTWSSTTSTVGLAACIASFKAAPSAVTFNGLPVLGAGA